MKPLISICVVAYNQARFVREAIEGAFQQTYSPLEIILSDDFSTDGTFEIMTEMAAAYRGPHQVRLNRMPRNSGVGAHINSAMLLARGELILAAAGDDVSLPNRAQAIWEAWSSAGSKVRALHSRVIHVDEMGREIHHATWDYSKPATGKASWQSATAEEYVRTLEPGIFGCAAAWTPELFKFFGELDPGLVHEDTVLTLRALLLGQLLYIDTPLLKYRLHGTNVSNNNDGLTLTTRAVQEQETRLQRKYARRAGMYSSLLADLKTAHSKGILADRDFQSATALAKKQQRICALQSKFLQSTGPGKVLTLAALVKAGAEPRQLRKCALRLLPARIFQSAKVWAARTRAQRAQAGNLQVAA